MTPTETQSIARGRSAASTILDLVLSELARVGDDWRVPLRYIARETF